jgi:adenine-specific DNA-methyltransferase
MPELVWDGKYDSAGRRVAPPKIELPFQTVETVNESAQERQRTLDFFAMDRPTDWRNRLIWGDKKYVLPSLLSEFAGQVDLIYIDPPFATGQNFSLPVHVDGADFVKQPSMLEVKAYRDTWGAGLDSYLEWFYGMVGHFHELLKETGCLYVHLDPGVSHLAKTLLDEIFGIGNFRSEITWKRTSAHSSAKRYGPVHDTLLFYSKSDVYTWNGGHQAYEDAYLKQRFKRGGDRPWKDADLTQAGTRAGETGKPWRGFNPTRDTGTGSFRRPNSTS